MAQLSGDYALFIMDNRLWIGSVRLSAWNPHKTLAF
jgi:hypothetical protein